jgi:hypothetical protein
VLRAPVGSGDMDGHGPPAERPHDGARPVAGGARAERSAARAERSAARGDRSGRAAVRRVAGERTQRVPRRRAAGAVVAPRVAESSAVLPGMPGITTVPRRPPRR